MTPERISVVMPAYNEADGIVEFLTEIEETFAEHKLEPVIGIVNDCSTDGTVDVIREFSATSNTDVLLVTNQSNLGHGPSSVRAWQLGLDSGTGTIVHVDGDGQFTAADMVAVALASREADGAVGIRVSREDPWFRTIVTWSLRRYLRILSRLDIVDANAPLRAYEADVLRELLDQLPPVPMIPSVYLSVASRTSSFDVLEVNVASRERRGDSADGSTWGKSALAFMPSRRLIAFVASAAREGSRTIRKLSSSRAPVRAQ
ncbi:MAG: glycosyltransferase family 2 protein [Acidimicrobiia bacterium]